jgi:hypothetical protein
VVHHLVREPVENVRQEVIRLAGPDAL